MPEQTHVPVDPAAVTLMASIVAKSLKQYSNKNPQTNLSSDTAIREISETVAVDMITAVAQLAGQVSSLGSAPTRPQSNKVSRGINAYKQNSKVDPYTSADDQYPESD